MNSAARSGIRNGHQYGFTPEPETMGAGYQAPPPLKTNFTGSEYSHNSPSQPYSPTPSSLSEVDLENFRSRYSAGGSNLVSRTSRPHSHSQMSSPATSSLYGRDSEYSASQHSLDTQSYFSGSRPDSRYALSPTSSSCYTSTPSTPASFQSFSSTPSSMSVQRSESRYGEHPWETQSTASATQEPAHYVPTPMSSYHTPSSPYQSPMSEPTSWQSPVSPVTEHGWNSLDLALPQRPISAISQTSFVSNPASSVSTLRNFVSRYPESPHSPAPSQAPSDITLQQFASRYPESPHSPAPSQAPSDTTLQHFVTKYPESPRTPVPEFSSLSLSNAIPPVPPPKIPLSPKHEPQDSPLRTESSQRDDVNSPSPWNTIRPSATPKIVQPLPHRPALPPPQFTQPYISTPYEHHPQTPTLATAQFEHPYSVTPQSPTGRDSAIPHLPGRPISAPAGKHVQWSTETSRPPSIRTSIRPEAPDYPATVTVPSHPEDEKSPLVTRFVANMLVMRVGRSTVQSMQSTAKLPFYLSPWGDNNPITLPNVRKRDIAMGGFMKFGVEPLAPSAVTLVEHVIKKAVHMAVEETAEYGVHKFRGQTPDKRLKRRVGIDSLTLRIKHKLIGEEAELVFLGKREAIDKRSCAKAWFNPYLYASGRSPDIARSKDFSIAQLLRPGLVADASIAPTLLSTFAETNTPITALCPWESIHPTFPRYRRMAVFLAAISPYRTANAWSQSRIPNEARLCFHLFTHIPALILPVLANTPVLAWSPWTVKQMLSSSSTPPFLERAQTIASPPANLDYDHHLAYGDTSFLAREERGSKKGKKYGYDPKNHQREIMDFLERVVDDELMDAETRNQWRKVAQDGVESIINGVLDYSTAVRATAVEVCDLERAGIVMFRY